MKSSARLVVIESGVVGCFVLYHPAKNGWTDVALFELQELTSGSSRHAAGGLFTVVRPNSATEMHRYTFQIYRELEKESGRNCGFHFTGGLKICRTQDEVDSNARMLSAFRRLGIEGRFISLDEAKAKAPVLDTRRMVGAFGEEGGHVDPASDTHAFAAAARKIGAAIHRFTSATATTQCAQGASDVVAEKGRAHAEFTVNAAELWAARSDA